MIWNFTRGIDAGEVVYSLNYNILGEDQSGAVNANDARRLFPQGHGDAYGHYLTALKGYYSFLLNSNFDWVPRIEAVTVLAGSAMCGRGIGKPAPFVSMVQGRHSARGKPGAGAGFESGAGGVRGDTQCK